MMSHVRGLSMLAAVVAASLSAAAHGAGPGKVFFEDTVPSGSSSSVTLVTHRPPAFRVLLRVPTQGTAKLFLLGRNAPKGGPLVRTSPRRPTACEGAAGSFYCTASFEPLPKGTYTWRITWAGLHKAPAHVELTLRW
jgi:hypothetical protein